MKDLPLKSRIRLVRLAKGMNKNEMAKSLCISPSYLTRLENSERAVPQHIIEILDLDCPTTFRWYRTLMIALQPFKKHYLTEDETDEVKRTLKKVLGI